MASSVPDTVLDGVLAVQLMVAWAGEGRSEPRRLGWWDTDLIDPAGGGDFFARLLPRTHAWASLEAAREAARRVDAKARAKMGDPDGVRTIFFLGYELDEQLADRLAALKRGAKPPKEALPLQLELGASFSQEEIEKALHGQQSSFTTVPNGRQLKGKRPESPDEMVQRLASALLPFASEYPLPFYKLEA